MTMIVVFDTNVYRSMFGRIQTPVEVEARIKELVDKEARKGVEASMSSVVAMELLNHLRDPSDATDFKSCLNAAQALYLHTGDKASFRLLPLPEVQIAKEYFDQPFTSVEYSQEVLGRLLYEISQDPQERTLDKMRGDLEQVSTYLSDVRSAVADAAKRVVEDKISKEYKASILSDEFKRETARAMLCAVYMRLKGVPEEETFNVISEEMINTYVKSHAVSLCFRAHFWSCFIDEGFDLSGKRSNSIFDEMILSHVGRTINNEEILLVTGDAKMHEAAEALGYQDRIMNVKEYKAFLDES